MIRIGIKGNFNTKKCTDEGEATGKTMFLLTEMVRPMSIPCFKPLDIVELNANMREGTDVR
jgi:hypothetical protein